MLKNRGNRVNYEGAVKRQGERNAIRGERRREYCLSKRQEEVDYEEEEKGESCQTRARDTHTRQLTPSS